MSHYQIPDPTDPHAISDHLLDRTRAAYLTNSFTNFKACFHLPHRLETFEGERLLETVSEFRQVFETMRDVMRDLGVIDMNRRTLAASLIGPDRVDATSITEYILHGYKVSEEVICHSTLIRSLDGWKIRESRYATKMAMVSRALIQK